MTIQKGSHGGHNQTIITKKKQRTDTRMHPRTTTPSLPNSNSSSGASVDYNGTNSFAACLYWMDDSQRLIEFIAYHYQVLPLRHLVFFKDPKSTEDPLPILDRWRPFMEITYWDSLDNLTYVPSKAILKQLEGGPPIAYHNKQQGLFVSPFLFPFPFLIGRPSSSTAPLIVSFMIQSMTFPVS